MARRFRCGAGAPYGCGHHDEHVRAARLGWLRRRLGVSATAFASADESRWLARITGEVRHAHTHQTHPNVIAFKRGRIWYEMPRAEFKRLVRAGRDMEREERAEAKRQDRAEVKEQRYRAMQERQVRAIQRAERAEVVKIIKGAGGIAPYRPVAGSGKVHDRAEYLTLPADVRRKSGRYNMDTAALAVNEEMPWLHIETPGDLVQFFVNSQAVRQQQAYQKRRA